ncbi:type II secretion system minor pseudopilin GspJ [Litorilituus lipolyticus]|uniref:Type II secretion system protein J n=1 Tax=Litorilituus lipolyticus TaxID=2491017 RepID=A0A502KUB0_9GAMM|nr:type II secretion system minor pseudopilin GspJ [Litorilituus lipolyticus]TPH15248.1 type II secretion system protein GspJ [Litorilituus lipolyticus]
MNSIAVSHRRQVKSSSGFTLLEVLIAIAIFSVVGLASFTIFDTVQRGDETSKLRSARQNELQRAFILIERDLSQLARRSIRINGEAPSKQYLQTAEESFLENEQALAFVRHGWTNPGMLLPRSELQAVAYRLRDEMLERLHYNFVDAVVGEEPKVRPLISEVNGISFEFYDGKEWQDKWPKQELPLAIAIEVDTQDFGLIRRQFLVAGETVPARDNADGR